MDNIRLVFGSINVKISENIKIKDINKETIEEESIS